jgi:hypothetical protein
MRYWAVFILSGLEALLLQSEQVTNNQDARATADNFHIRHRETGNLQIELTYPILKIDLHSSQSQ